MATNKSKPKFNIGDKAIFREPLYSVEVTIQKRTYDPSLDRWYYTVTDGDRYPFQAREGQLESIK